MKTGALRSQNIQILKINVHPDRITWISKLEIADKCFIVYPPTEFEISTLCCWEAELRWDAAVDNHTVQENLFYKIIATIGKLISSPLY